MYRIYMSELRGSGSWESEYQSQEVQERVSVRKSKYLLDAKLKKKRIKSVEVNIKKY